MRAVPPRASRVHRSEHRRMQGAAISELRPTSPGIQRISWAGGPNGSGMLHPKSGGAALEPPGSGFPRQAKIPWGCDQVSRGVSIVELPTHSHQNIPQRAKRDREGQPVHMSCSFAAHTRKCDTEDAFHGKSVRYVAPTTEDDCTSTISSRDFKGLVCQPRSNFRETSITDFIPNHDFHFRAPGAFHERVRKTAAILPQPSMAHDRRCLPPRAICNKEPALIISRKARDK